MAEIIQRPVKVKRKFDVNSEDDVNLFVKFLKDKAWGKTGCPFTLEYPYLSVPDMIKDKLLYKFLNIN